MGKQKDISAEMSNCIVRMHGQGGSYRSIAKATGVTPEGAGNVIEVFFEGTLGVKRSTNIWKRKTNAPDDRRIIPEVKKNCHATTKITRYWWGQDVSKTVEGYRMKEKGVKYLCRASKTTLEYQT